MYDEGIDWFKVYKQRSYFGTLFTPLNITLKKLDLIFDRPQLANKVYYTNTYGAFEILASGKTRFLANTGWGTILSIFDNWLLVNNIGVITLINIPKQVRFNLSFNGLIKLYQNKLYSLVGNNRVNVYDLDKVNFEKKQLPKPKIIQFTFPISNFFLTSEYFIIDNAGEIIVLDRTNLKRVLWQREVALGSNIMITDKFIAFHDLRYITVYYIRGLEFLYSYQTDKICQLLANGELAFYKDTKLYVYNPFTVQKQVLFEFQDPIFELFPLASNSIFIGCFNNGSSQYFIISS